jgi:all-trans-8'-apo-beta-carotenal 15,15'-oxygenase
METDRLFDERKVKRGWESLEREFEYWVPQADIIGRIPDDLRGTFLRNGPGVNEVYGKKLKHPIDGDGMVCAVTFVDGQVHFRSKFVSSSHRRKETQAKRFLYKGQMGTDPSGTVSQFCQLALSLLRGKMPTLEFRNPSNTSVFYWGGKILTTYETQLPHCLDPYSLETLGLDDLGGMLKLKTMAAHYKVDTEKGVRNYLFCLY